jgi:tetratricopeptide (TPR) repeat protein
MPMPFRYLLGPVSRRFGEQNVARQRQSGECKTFGRRGCDLVASPHESWPTVAGRLPAGWHPDAIICSLAAEPVPRWAWSASVPVVGLATGWPLLWHAYRRQLAGCDLVLADVVGAERLARTGVRPVLEANLFGCERQYLERAWPTAAGRDIDVLVVSNLPRPALREQLPLFGKVARLGRDWRVSIRCELYGREYRQLLGRTRIVVNHSLAGECTFRAFETAASGALLFQEAANRELPAWLREGDEYIGYDLDSVADRLTHYLRNESERLRVAEAARKKVSKYSWEALWQERVPHIERALSVGPPARRPEPGEAALLARCWHTLGLPASIDATLARDLQAAVAERPDRPGLHLALGLVEANAAPPGLVAAEKAVAHFRTAARLAPASPVAALSLAEALDAAGDHPAALEHAQRGLELVSAPPSRPPDDLDWLSFPPTFDTFRVEWERAAWRRAGDPNGEAEGKYGLLRWKLQALVARLSGELPPAYEQVLARPDLAASWVTLGSQFQRVGQPRQATPHLRRALELDPFNPAAARALSQIHQATQPAIHAELVGERRELSRIAPQLVPPEPWFTPGPVADVVPASPALSTRKPGRRKRVSLTMIVRDEERNLPECLASVADLVDEIIVADTGSVDRTREIALRFGACLVEAPWSDNFATARNAALERASGDWVWWLDADDRLDAENRPKADALFDRLGDEPDAYAMKVRSRLNATGTAARILDQIRLFPRHPKIRWRYRVHEQIMPSVRDCGGEMRWSDVLIEHLGYQDRRARKRKLERNLRLLRLDEADHPDDSYTLFNLGWTSFDTGQFEDALRYLRRSLSLARPTTSYVRKLHVLLAQAHGRIGQTAEALAACDDALGRFPDDLELLFERAIHLHEAGDHAAAEQTLRKLLAVRPGQYLASVDAGLRGYRAFHLLGELCRAQGRVAEAEHHWQAAVAERPDFAPVWVALGELWLREKRWGDVEKAAERLHACEASITDAIVLRVRGRLAAGDEAAARQLLEDGLAANPNAGQLRQLLDQLQAPVRVSCPSQ